MTDLSRLDPRIQELLRNRGIREEEQAAFLYPEKEPLAHCYLLPGVKEGAERVFAALNNGEKITIYGDYDADGITSTALLYRGLRTLTEKVSWYIPQREGEGYGLNQEALEVLLSEGTGLVITVDCGIKSLELVKDFTKRGMDFLITDHHTPDKELPQAIVINPKYQAPDFFYDLAGVGVAYQLMEGLTEHFPSLSSLRPAFWQLVALGTVADLVDLKKENRKLVKRGLLVMNQSPIPGIAALLDACDKRTVDSRTIAFSLAPLINSSGRMESPEKAMELLIQEDRHALKEIAAELLLLNQRRKEVVEKIYLDAKEKIVQRLLFEDPVLVLWDSGWHQGVLGIVAARLMQEYGRPVLLFTQTEPGVYKGSARSTHGYSIFDALQRTEKHILQFGGHAQAAGLAVEESKMEGFHQAIKKDAFHYLDSSCLESELSVDLFLDGISSITPEFYQQLSLLEPYGAGNPEPIFSFSEPVQLTLQKIGKNKEHLRVESAQNGQKIQGVYFFYKEFREGTFSGEIAFGISQNIWRNRASLQLEIKRILSLAKEKTTNAKDYVYGNFMLPSGRESGDKDFTFIKKIKYNEICNQISEGKHWVYSRDPMEIPKGLSFPDASWQVLDIRDSFSRRFQAMRTFLMDPDCRFLISDFLLADRLFLEQVKGIVLLDAPFTRGFYFKILEMPQPPQVYTLSELTDPILGAFYQRDNLGRIWLFLKKEAKGSLLREDFRKLSARFFQECDGAGDSLHFINALQIFQELGFLEYNFREGCLEIVLQNHQEKKELAASPLFRRISSL